MADDNSTALTEEEKSILEEYNATDPDSEEQQVDEADEDNEDSQEDPQGQLSNKFQTKTSQKLSELSELATFLLDETKIKELEQRKPELAERLKRNSKFSHLFEGKSEVTRETNDDSKDKISETLRNIEINGTKLPSSDIEDALRKPEFMRRAAALIKSGEDRFAAVEYALSKAYGVKHNRAPSVLNRASEEIPYSSALPKLSKEEKQLASIYGLTEEELSKAKLTD
jgi:hypothetical protein